MHGPLPYDFQSRCAAWRKEKFPGDGVAWVALKAAEELGEMARAIIGEHENREGRGDPVHEGAQVILVVASLIGQFYPDRDVLYEAFQELTTKENEIYTERQSRGST